MHPVKSITRQALATLGMFLGPTLFLSGCGGGDSQPVALPAPITVSVSPGSAVVLAGATQALAATVQNDAARKGVSWSISPATGAGTLSNVTSTSVTYNAPATTPPSDTAVTITATAVADAARTASATIAVLALSVSVAPDAATVQVGATLSVSAAVQGDPTGQGVTWIISPASGAGTLSDVTATSVTYNAPPTAPVSNVTVTVTATSVSDPTRSAAATIDVPAIWLTLTPPGAVVPAGTAQSFTVSAQYDSTPAEVTWRIFPGSGAGSLSEVTSTSVTYHAPADAPQSPLTVVLTATLVGGNPVSVSATITVPVIGVTVSPLTALLPVNATQTFTVSVSNDPTSGGVAWSLAQNGNPCAPDCGTIASVDATSANFMAPARLPALAQVSVIASSLTDPTKSGGSAVTLSSNIVKIVPYALYFGHVHKYNTVSRTTTLTNTGSTALSINSVNISGADASFYTQANACSGSLLPGMSCDIVASFKPNAVIRKFVANLEIADSSTDSPQVVSLTGYGCGTCRTSVALTTLAATKLVVVPRPTGTNAVGTRIMQLNDVNRADPFLANGSRRELMLRFWYPAATGGACTRAAYTNPAVWRYFSELAGIPLPMVRTNSCLNAHVADGAYPIVVFSHGLTGTNTDYTYLFEDLASRGYVVVSVAHTYETTAVAFADGRMARSLYGSHLTRIVPMDETALALVESARLGDLRFVVDELQKLNARANGPFATHLDTAAIATAGHSFGGLTALQALAADPRIRAAISLDGIVPDGTFSATDRAVLILDTGRQQWNAEERGLWIKLLGPRLAVNLRNSEHVTASDIVWMARGAVKTGNLSSEAAIDVMRKYVAGFLDTQLLGRPANYLRRSAEYRDVEVTLPTQVPDVTVGTPATAQ